MIVGYARAPSGCNCTPAYVTGNRSASITVTSTMTLQAGVSVLVDGTITSQGNYPVGGQTVAGLEMKFQFSSSTKITGVKIYSSDNSGAAGVWKFEGSNDGASWTTLGINVDLSGPFTITDTSMAANVDGYLYYRYLGVSGTTASSGRSSINEFEFEQCTC